MCAETNKNVKISLQKRSTRFCSELPKPRFSITTCSNKNALGSECQFECEPGFTLLGVSAISCVQLANKPQWSNPPPFCTLSPGM